MCIFKRCIDSLKIEVASISTYCVIEMLPLKASNIAPQADLVYTSGSGLDPHISIPSAQAQIQRVAIARNLNIQQIEELVNKNIDRRFLGIFGEPGINVLKLNLALDQLSSNKS